MSPRDYIRVREEATVSGDKDYVAIIDEKPYYPLLMVDPSDQASILATATKIMGVTSATTDLNVVRVQGGNTNNLFRVSGFQQEDYDSVLMRVFGGEGLIDRDIENPVFAALSRAGIAPKYLGRFGNGRLEGWIDARALGVQELSVVDFSKSIAKLMSELHRSFKAPADLEEYFSEPSLWKQLFGWMDQTLNAKFRTERDTQKAEELGLKKLPDELEWLREKVVPANAKISFCHNDVLAANVLLEEDSRTLHLIDFEYGGVNYIAFDIANHFNEFAGGTDEPSGIPNYDWLPSEELQRTFVESYLGVEENSADTKSKEVDSLLQEVRAFRLVNHLYWGLWAINQAATEGCEEFDYMVYGTQRVRQYYSDKKSL